MPKELIYHYTTSAGLRGIITSQELWATNAWFMNDRGEATFGFNAVLTFLKSKKPRSEHEAAALPEAIKYIERIRKNDGFYQSYIACLSKKSDLLSQWRAYGKDGGFSIGFDREELGEIEWPDRSNYRLLEVSYKESANKKSLQDYYDKNIGQADSDSTKAGMSSAVNAILFVSGIKHPAFKEEAEVRLHAIRFHVSPDSPFPKDVEFRDSPMGITPYVKLPLRKEEDIQTSAMKEIIVGPQRHSAEAVMAVTQLLRSQGLSAVRVRPSKIPLRS